MNPGTGPGPDTDEVDKVDEVFDSPDPSVAEHVRRYLATDGASGHMEGGSPNLVLTYRGRKSGKRYRTGLFYGVDGDRYVLVASGSAITHTHPLWYLNLVATPEADVQVRGEHFAVRARTAQGEERERLWRLMTGLAPVYLTYEERTRRTIPVVVLERVPAIL
ncbi:nitroreductase family deazaflavin-dependent oxidoreductase [Streptomyces sp. NPDC057554]|uniref:nitroreductase family deazaflavin-dependent oxidoreductase n=1 Tax=Streptomyces sp. NPDC057554 TaxID=3350538 RepID=UPI00369BB78C